MGEIRVNFFTPARSIFVQKRQKILTSATNLVEIDLLRSGQPFPMVGAVPSDYRILISRSPQRPKAQLYALCKFSY